MYSFNNSSKDSKKLSIAKNLKDLLILDGASFLESAYHTLLGRDIDQEGKAHYMERFNSGRSKIAILDEIMRSPEIKDKKINCIGLEPAIKKYRLQKNKFFSRKVNKVRYLFQKKLVKITSYVDSFKNINLNNKHVVEGNIAEKLDNVSKQLAKLNDILQQNIQTISSNNVAAKYINDESAININYSNVNLEDNVDSLYSYKDHTIVFNLTTSKHWKAHPVGIIRVERELAKFLSKMESTLVRFVIWDPDLKKLKWLSNAEINQILSDQWTNGEYANLTTEQELSSTARIYELNQKDVFVSLGLDWDLTPIHEIAELIEQSNAKAVLGCYDIIPILFPEYCVRPDFDQIFKTHFVNMGHCASRIWVDSECSKTDLTNFLAKAELGKELPQIKFISLGANVKSDKDLPKLNEYDASILRHVNFLGDYIIYVSSFESRKNHRLLVNIWRELYAERGDDCPQLVIVGMKGWGVDDLLNLMSRMFVQKAEKINFLPNVSDDLLLHLYKHTKFGVFPSLYEGWGLAATELLSFNKTCIVANNSALIEATQGLMPSYHPLDFLGWKAEIEKLWDDSKYRINLEKKIKNNFTPRTWESFAQDFACQMLDLENLSS